MSPVDGDDVLSMRLAAERARMADLTALLPMAAAAADPVRTNLRDRITARDNEMAGLDRQPDGWESWGDTARDADALVDESIARVVTGLLRQNGLEAGIFDAAEALLAELSRVAGVPAVMLGQTQKLESMDHTRGVVAMRFPGSRVWDLPFLAHEFGHHATAQLRNLRPELADSRPLGDVATEVARLGVAAGASPTRATAHAEELVADAVATVCCGPTYPIACLCLRVPRVPESASETHPPWRSRIALMRTVLDRLTGTTGLARYAIEREDVVDPLAAEVLGQVPAADAAGTQAADRTVATMVKHRPDLVYRGADDAIRVAAALDRRQPGAPAVSSVTAVLDGAWRWRLRQTSRKDDDAVAALVERYCRT